MAKNAAKPPKHGKIRRRYGRKRPPGEVSVDPATKVKDAAPNFGRPFLPQILTFSGMQSTVSHTYRNPDEAIRHSIENARFMRNDPAIMECVEARQRSTALLNWHLEPEDKDDPQQKELVADLTAILEEIERFTEYRRNLLEAIWYGRCAIQNRYEKRKVKGVERTVIKKWTPVNGDKLAFRYDDGTGRYDPDQIGIRVGGAFTQVDKLAGDRIIEQTEFGLAYFLDPWERPCLAVHKHMIEDGAYEDPISAGRIHGVGVRDRIYWCWFQKQETMAHLMEIIERTGAGFTIYYYQYGNDESYKKMKEVAENQTATNVILMPRMAGDESMDAHGIERIEPSTAGIDALKSIIHEFFGHQIKRYILGQILSSESAATGLGSGVADLHLDTFMQIVQYDAINLEETITTEVLEPLIRFNFPWAREIRIKFKIDTKDADSESKLQAYKTAWDMGAKLKASDVMDIIGASMPDEDDEVLQNPAMQQQQRLWEQAHPGDLGQDGAVTGEDGQPAPEGSIEDQFGPLAAMLGNGGESGGGEQGPPGDGGNGGGGPGSPPGDGPQQYAKSQVKSSPGQRSMFDPESHRSNAAAKWKEELHPRDEGGQFAEKGAGHKTTATEAPGGRRAKQAVSSPGQKGLSLEGDAREQVGQDRGSAKPGEMPFSLSNKPVRGKSSIPGLGNTQQKDLFAGRGDSPGQGSFFDDVDPGAKNVGDQEPSPPHSPLSPREAEIHADLHKTYKGLSGEELLDMARTLAHKEKMSIDAPRDEQLSTAAENRRRRNETNSSMLPSEADVEKFRQQAADAIADGSELPVVDEQHHDEIREALGVSRQLLDKYDPVSSVGKVGNKWNYKTLKGTDGKQLFGTRKEAIAAATKHKQFKQEQFDNPAGFRSIESVRAAKRLAQTEELMKSGMSEMEAGAQVRKDSRDSLDPHLSRASEVLARIPKVTAKGLSVQLNGEVSEEHAGELLGKLRGGESQEQPMGPPSIESIVAEARSLNKNIWAHARERLGGNLTTDQKRAMLKAAEENPSKEPEKKPPSEARAKAMERQKARESVPKPATGDELKNKIRERLAEGPQGLGDMRHDLGHRSMDRNKPLGNAVHAAVKEMHDSGELHVEQPQFGDPIVSLKKPKASELTSADREKLPEHLKNINPAFPSEVEKLKGMANANKTGPEQHAETIRQHLDNDDHESAIKHFESLKKDDVERVHRELTGSGFYNQSKSQMLDKIRQTMPHNTKSARNARAADDEIDDARSEYLKAKEYQEAHANGLLGSPLSGTSETAFKDPHGAGKEEVTAAWQREVEQGKAKLDAALKKHNVPEFSDEQRGKLIDQITSAARKPLPNIVERVKFKGSDGKMYYPEGVPFGVKLTDEKQSMGFAYQSPDGTTYGNLGKTRQELVDRHNEGQDQKTDEFRKILADTDNRKLLSHAKAWKVDAPKEKPPEESSEARAKAMESQELSGAKEVTEEAAKSRKWTKNDDGTYTSPNGTVWKKAAAGGEESPVTGGHFKGGALMPIHGLHQGPAKKPPKGEGGGDSKPNEKAKQKEWEEPKVRQLTPEQIAEEKARRELQAKWDKLHSGPLKEFMNISEKPGKFASTISNKWRNVAKELGPQKTKELYENILQPMFNEQIEQEMKEAPSTMSADEARNELNRYYDRIKKDHADLLYPKNIMAKNPHALEVEAVMRHVEMTPERLESIGDAISKLRRGESLSATPPQHSPAVQSAIDAAHQQLHEAGLAEKPSYSHGAKESDIPYDVALNAHRGTSFVPEKRAKQRQQDFVNQMSADWDHLAKFAGDDDKKLSQLSQEFSRYRDGFREKTLAYLHANSRVMSTMITGASKFPVRANEKRQDTAHRRLNELLDFRKRAMAAIQKKLSPETGIVKSSDSNAVATLQKQLDSAKKFQEVAKSVNKIVRAHVESAERDGGAVTFKKGKTRESAMAEMMALGISEKTASEALKGDFMGRVGIPGYSLTNNNANMRRIEQRIKSLSEMKAGGEKETHYSGGVSVHEDPEAARIRIKFPGKPERSVIEALKGGGFRWSPSEGAWQRHLNNSGRYAVDSMLEKLGHKKIEASEAAPPTDDEPEVPEMIPVVEHDEDKKD